MQVNENDIDLATNDLGPLAWVLDELRKSLDSASSALRRFVRDTALARGTDMASVDGGQLRIARQQLHQAVGALEMVGLGAPAHVLRSMEGAVQKFVERPELCTEAAAAKVERAGFALTEYLEALLLGKPVSAVALFPQYRDIQELAGADRVHPADLWNMEWRWNDPATPPAAERASYEPAVRSRLDQRVLKLVKSGDPDAARELAGLSLSLAATQTARQPAIFWKVCAAYFEAVGQGLLPLDIPVKRVGSRILQQYAALAKGEQAVSDRLAHDLVFFCAQAVPARATDAPALMAVRQAWALDRFQPIDYQTPHFGRYDPALLAQARKRIVTAKDTWSGLSGGDAGKLKGVTDQFNLVRESLSKVLPQGAALGQALVNAVEGVARSARAPGAELAMEVATAVLFLEAVYADLDPSDAQLAPRMARLAERLDTVRQGGQPGPLESWMEELYRRVSDRQTMGSVVGELRGTLSELEKLLDQFFRDPADKAPLADAPAHLSQMRGVLSVLGLDKAAHAVQHMRDTVDEIIATEVDEGQARAAGTFDKLGNNLGALGFLIDMLHYQPVLAKKLFVYDEATGELRPLMGRVAHPHETAQAPAEAAPSVPVFEAIPATVTLPQVPASAAPQATAPVSDDTGEEDELLDIFLEEAREVVANGLAAIEALAVAPKEVSEITTLRRAFHTLKGSSRMVGLNEFGEAAWSLEQVLNTWLADQKPVGDELRSLATEAMKGFGRWIEDISQHTDQAWKSSMFRGAADAMRLENRLVALALPGAAAPAAAAELTFEIIEAVPVPELPPEPVAPALMPEPAAAAPEAHIELPADLPAFDLSLELEPVDPAPPSAPEATAQAAPIEVIEIELDAQEPAADFAASGRPPLTEAVEITVDELPADFDFPAAEAAAADDEPAPAALPEPVEIEGIDFESLSALSESAQPGAPAALQAEPQPQPEALAVPAEPADDEQVKVIGPLRIGIPLYNVYLNEADEWSRRLATEVAEWALELSQPVPDSAVGLAHALAGSSATVGFHSLSDIARALETSLGQTQRLAYGTPLHGRAFTAAADEIRRLLHQFAAGFLKDPQPGVIAALEALASLEIPKREQLRDSSFGIDEDEAASELAAPPEAAAAEPAVAAAQAASLHRLPVAAPKASRLDDLGDDEDIDVADAVDPDLFPIFEEEAVELMPQLGAALRRWSAHAGDRDARDASLRALHTLKGSARLAGALRLGERAHRMESHIETLGMEPVAADIEPLLHRFDDMQANFDVLRGGAGIAAVGVEASPQPEPQAAPQVMRAEPAAPAAELAPLAAPLQVQVAAMRGAEAARAATQSVPQRASANQAVRVRAQLLDRLVNQAGEVMITRTRLEAELGQLRGSLSDLTGNLDRLRSQLRDIELQAETQMQSRLAQAKDSAAGFDPLEFDRFTRVQELTRMMAESVNDVATVQRNIQRVVESTEDDLIAQARQTRELQRDLLRTRMVEFEGISDRLYRVVRLASKETGKQVKLDITGGSIEMDRGVLDRMTPSFEHLLRNCIAHGIEEPQVRVAAGKDPAGTIQIALHHEGNDVSVEFRDDGAGLNLARIREKALQQGLVSPGQQLSDAEAAQLIFMSGLSTASQVTELAGRGVGMDVVRADVNALGGRIETATAAGQGTSFKLVLPLTTAVTQVVMIRAGNLTIGVPANIVEIVRRATGQEVDRAYESGLYAFGEEQLPFHWCGALLQSSHRSIEPVGKTMPVMVFRSAAQRVAMHVDEVLGNQEVVVKNLGPQLARLPGLAGMTVLASGAVVLIYNPVALSAVYGEQSRRLSAAAAQQPSPQAPDAQTPAPVGPAESGAAQIPLVLVVDDSITVRRVTQRLLQREGYRVALAADGLQALERLAEEKPAVVLSDIEMPRMDGFDLARNIRADARIRDLPIIMITSRIAEKHREHAKELGVDHYLGKPYSEEELLGLVKHYSGATALA
ncbi:hybrid sensor histidine kinase/response regulator [Ramlibacter tataouinensis]|uniref:Chemotaxis protein CheA n=1 Tax=Ramlibacter tataouinensis TaxID=94132 RepID=A0A127JZG0_9BURK|nr:Hpt domain-containing protein [Ramlibacter tataouinensis]AMO25319.1 chemotaxis protein CheA [Ramlibacter tataouinensis]